MTSVLRLQKSICMRVGASSTLQDLMFLQSCSDFLLPLRGVNSADCFYSFYQIHLYHLCIPALRRLLIFRHLRGLGASLCAVSPVCLLALVIWEAPESEKTMASFVFPRSN